MSKNTSVELWFIIVRIGRIVRPWPSAGPHIDDEGRKTLGAFRGLVLRRRARQQQHQVGMFGPAGPDLLAVDDVFVALLAGEGAQRRRVGAAGRFGDAKRLQPQFAGGDFRQIGLLLLVGAVPQDGAHDVHLGVAGRAVAALGLNGFQDCRRGGQRQTGAAVFLGDQRAEIAAFGQRADKIRRVAAFLIELAPVFAGEPAAQLPDFFADFRVWVGAQRVFHGGLREQAAVIMVFARGSGNLQAAAADACHGRRCLPDRESAVIASVTAAGHSGVDPAIAGVALQAAAAC